MTLELLKEEVRKLSKLEKIVFVQYILDTISREVEEEGAALSEDWIQELNARREAYLNQTTKTFTWEEVKNKLPNVS